VAGRNAFNLLISRARHCFIHVKCIGGYDVTIELYGPQEDPKHGSPHMNPFNPNRGGTHFPITSPSGYKCCQLEVNLLNAFQKESGNLPIYNGYPGPNSNTFVFTIISEIVLISSAYCDTSVPCLKTRELLICVEYLFP
jgi:hypothetical protein